MKKKQTQIRQYAKIMSVFLVAVVIGLLIFFYCIQRSVEHRSQKMMMNNVSRQSVHLRTILNIQYAYLNGFAEEIGKSDQLLDQKNINLLQSVTKNTDFGATALIEPDGTSHYSNGQTKNVSHRRYYREAMSGKRTLSEPLDSSISGSTRVVLGVPIYKDKKVIGILGGSYDVTALSRMLFEDLFDGEGCSMIIAQSGEVIAFEGDTSYWNIDYRDNFYTYCKKLMIKDNVTAKMIKQDFYKGKSNLVTADSKKKGNVRHYFAYMPMKINNWMLCYAVPEKTAQQSYDFIEHYEIIFMAVFVILVILLVLYIVHENYRRDQELMKYAQTDALTGLYNKETTKLRTDEILSTDKDMIHAFLILDMDCFKQINDGYGHAVGDIVLQKFGQLLRDIFREDDIVGRIGGDEFVFVSSSSALAIAISFILIFFITTTNSSPPIRPTISSSLKISRNNCPNFCKKKAVELFESGRLDSMQAGTVDSLKKIHQFLFEDIYEFAGEIRTVNLAKGNFRFAPVMYLQPSLNHIEQMPQSDFEQIIEKYVEMNIAHPFREGNGRSTRIWLDQILKKELKQVIDWSKVDKEDYLLAMERSPIRDIEIKYVLKQALTDKIHDREIYMKGIDHSYYYEGYMIYKSEEL